MQQRVFKKKPPQRVRVGKLPTVRGKKKMDIFDFCDFSRNDVNVPKLTEMSRNFLQSFLITWANFTENFGTFRKFRHIYGISTKIPKIENVHIFFTPHGRDLRSKT